MDPSTLASLKTAAVLLVKTVECPICLEVLADPLCTNCHHRFCRACIEKALHGKYKIPCPLCKAVVTKRSLLKIDHIEQIVEKVKQLSNAIREDTGFDASPPRHSRMTAVASPEGHLFEEFGRAHPSPMKCYGRSKSAATAVALRRSKRAVSVNSDSEVVSNTTKRSRSTSDIRSYKALETSGIKPLVNTRTSQRLPRATSNQPAHEGPQLQASSSALPVRGLLRRASAAAEMPCIITAGDSTSSVSSCSSFNLQVRQPSESQAGTITLSDGNAGNESSTIGAISQSEKVGNWLQTCETVVPVVSANPKDPVSNTGKNETVQGARKSMPNRFFTTSKPVRKLGSPAGRKKLLDVSDSDPYKFVPSQRSLHAAAQKGKRRRPRGGCRGTRTAPARKTKAKSPLRGFENLRDYCAEEAAVKNGDAQELEIELFVTPGDMLQGNEDQVPKAPQSKKRTMKDASRRQSKRMKRSMLLQKTEEEAKELQQKINGAEGFELAVLKETWPGLPNKPIAVAALKDVSNLRVPTEKSSAQGYPMSPKRPGRVELGFSAQRSSAEVTAVRQTLNDRTSELEPGPDTDMSRPEKTSSLSLNKKQNHLNVKRSSEPSISTTAPKELPSYDNLSRGHEETEGEVVSSKPIGNEHQPSELHTEGQLIYDNHMEENPESLHIEGQGAEDNHVEEHPETPAMSLKDLEGLFKKSSRKTFDISADTQDLESLSSGALSTLDLISNICNELEEEPIARRSPAAATAKDSSPAVPRKEALPEKRDILQSPASASIPITTMLQGSTKGMTRNRAVSQEASDMPSSLALASTASYEETCEELGNSASEPRVETCLSCPNCTTDIVVSWVNGITKVTLKGTSRKPVLVDVGMCTERPGNRVIICKEAVTQTDIVDVNQSCSEAALNQRGHQEAPPVAALPVPSNSVLCSEVSPTIEREVHVSDASNHASTKENIPLLAMPDELHSRSVSSDKPVDGGSSVIAFKKPSENVQTCSVKFTDGNEAEMENVQAEVAEVTSVSETRRDGQSSPKQNNEDSEVICDETEEQFQVSERQLVDKGFQCQLQTIIEDSELMDASPFSENGSPDEVAGTAVGPLVGEVEEPEHGNGDCTQSGLQSSVEAACTRGQDESLTKKAEEYHIEQAVPMEFGCIEEEVMSVGATQQQVREARPPPSIDRMQNEGCSSRALDAGCSDETYLPSYDHFLASPEARADKPHSRSSQPRQSAACAATVSINFNSKEQENVKHSYLKTSQVSLQLAPAEVHRASSCCQEKHQSVTMVSPANAPHDPTGYKDNKGCSDAHPLRAELSPWASPVHSGQTASSFNIDIQDQLNRNSEESRGDEADFRTCSASPEKQSDASKRITGGEREKSTCISKTSERSEKVLVTVEDSDSDSSVMLDPMTESEASDLLQRAFAMEEDSPDEVALNFAKRAVAPLRTSAQKRLSLELQLVAERHTPPDTSAAALLKSVAVPASEREEADNTENTEGPSTVTVSSTLSGALDRTLKEQLLEQDIQEMKKQMLMLECELQRTTAGNGCVGDLNQDVFNDSDFKESEEDEAKRSASVLNKAAKPTEQGKEAGKADNWDNCFSDSDDEMPDVVPPTPPRKLILNKELTFNRGVK
ncbi:uncharacterized protein LOC8034297 isoform X1 [Ixodes scapularis]|uniref:uncharacterized protein LOC8034297 isoform X1 n=1 Tax=Ixodes scapularis TaxID=6945 RepID=UPI001C38D3FD|nr:uncharacterized protein LOC8034297 isoform X1 [Ixodes scapularis]